MVLKKILLGIPSSPGEAIGIAKIAFDPTEANSKIQDGDILVVPMTNPDYIPAILKASAIVTNFGGILCHAAIVCRELGKPCVTGTKNATEVLKNNPKILVKGDTGEVFVYEEG